MLMYGTVAPEAREVIEIEGSLDEKELPSATSEAAVTPEAFQQS